MFEEMANNNYQWPFETIHLVKGNARIHLVDAVTALSTKMDAMMRETTIWKMEVATSNMTYGNIKEWAHLESMQVIQEEDNYIGGKLKSDP